MWDCTTQGSADIIFFCMQRHVHTRIFYAPAHTQPDTHAYCKHIHGTDSTAHKTSKESAIIRVFSQKRKMFSIASQKPTIWHFALTISDTFRCRNSSWNTHTRVKSSCTHQWHTYIQYIHASMHKVHTSSAYIKHMLNKYIKLA